MEIDDGRIAFMFLSHAKYEQGSEYREELFSQGRIIIGQVRRCGGNEMKQIDLRKMIVLACILLAVFCNQATANEKQEGYVIGSGDILEIVTWKEPDFSRDDILVRLDGYITFPLINDIKASGLTPIELKKKLEDKLKDYVKDPKVTVIVKNPTSQKFYILGEIARTGEYPLIKQLTVLQAFALAGGFTEWASKKEIILLRKENGKDKVIRINYKKIVKGVDFSQNVMLKADDTIIVP